MTIHQSKGLEFPIVVAGMPNNRQGPRTQYSETDAILQENYYQKPPFEPLELTKNYDFWRLYYTAFSRPQNLLVLSCYEQKNKNGTYSSPNKLFKNLYEQVPSWKKSSFDASKLELETIKPANIKHEYSFTSHILLYENCPQQYKFYKELEFTEVRTGGVLAGQLLHQTIEDIHKTVLKGQESTLTNENIENWFNTNYYLLSKQQRSYLHKPQQIALLKQVLNYRDKNTNDWDKIVEAEVDVSLVKEDYILKGTIDLIRGEEGTVELIDFKSGDKPDVNGTDVITKNTLDRYRRQLEVYAHLVEERTGHKVSKMHLHYPKVQNGSPYITFNKSEHTINKTIETFDKVVQNIENKNFDNSHIVKNEKQCSDCDMRYYCNPRQY
jgi:DNA helicase-2/ATP-dependent DNA helicase PcrA